MKEDESEKRTNGGKLVNQEMQKGRVESRSVPEDILETV